MPWNKNNALATPKGAWPLLVSQVRYFVWVIPLLLSLHLSAAEFRTPEGCQAALTEEFMVTVQEPPAFALPTMLPADKYHSGFENLFVFWAAEKFNVIVNREETPKLIKKEIEQLFLSRMGAAFQAGRQQLVALYKAKLASWISVDSEEFPGSETFRNESIPTYGLVGSKDEGAVYFTRVGGRFAVLKQFHSRDDHENFEFHLKIHRKLEEHGLPVAKLMDYDTEEMAFLMSFVPGLTFSDITLARQRGEIDRELEKAYMTHQFLFMHEMKNALSQDPEISREEVLKFNPHGNNVSYNPLTGRFTIFDIR